MPRDFLRLSRLLDYDANNNPILNIGAAGTDFSVTGGLTLADDLLMTNQPIDNVRSIDFVDTAGADGVRILIPSTDGRRISLVTLQANEHTFFGITPSASGSSANLQLDGVPDATADGSRLTISMKEVADSAIINTTVKGAGGVRDLHIQYNGVTVLEIANAAMAFFAGTPSARGAAIIDAAGGATVDAEARTAINALLAKMRLFNLITP